MQGSMFRNADGFWTSAGCAPGWLNDPLSQILAPFMSGLISTQFGPQNPPYLSAITSLTGSLPTALASVPTVPLPVGYIVEVTITGDQRFQLNAGILTGPGTVAPNDQALSQKTWTSIS